MRRASAFDRVDQAARLAGGGNQVIPAPGREMPALPADAGHVGGDRIEPAKIVQQPAVEAVGLQRRLDGRDIERCGRACGMPPV